MDTIREYVISEFHGKFPDVPIASGVDLEALKENQAAPFFVTLPIVPEIGAISSNGLLYDDALVKSIEEQINRKRPGGIFGHLKDEERATAFPLPSGMWIGAKREGNTLWAKAWIPAGKSQDYMRQLKAVGGQIATSIYGKGDREKVKPGVDRLTNFNLESLDFAPPERAALGYGATPILTAELHEDNNDMDKTQLLAELTVSDIPAALKEQILAAAGQKTQVVELTTQVKDRDTLISELQTSVAEFRKAAFAAALDGKVNELTNWQVKGEAAKAKLEAFRRTLRSRIVAELGADQKVERIAEVVTAVWTDLQPLAETVRDALAGPPAIVNGKVRGDSADPRKAMAAMTPTELEQAMSRARAGFNF